jgi:hypothetical protein
MASYCTSFIDWCVVYFAHVNLVGKKIHLVNYGRSKNGRLEEDGGSVRSEITFPVNLSIALIASLSLHPTPVPIKHWREMLSKLMFVCNRALN